MTNLLTPKTSMPTLDVPTVDGSRFTIAEASPENFLIIVAYRGLHCPKCKKQLEQINGMMADIRADGHDLIAISMDSEERAKKAKEEWDIADVPLGYSLDLLTAKALGLFISDAISDKEPNLFSEPGIFVVNSDGTLYAEIIQNTPFGRPDVADLVAGLNYAVENDYPTRGTSVA